MRHRLRVYISGPITGDGTVEAQHVNIKIAKRVASLLITAGFAPLCPHANSDLDLEEGFEHGVWMQVDLPWVSQAQAVLRIPGDSVGGDIECDYARRLGIPVLEWAGNLHQLIAWREKQEAVDEGI